MPQAHFKSICFSVKQVCIFVVALFTLPPHTSHMLQTFDVCVFGPFAVVHYHFMVPSNFSTTHSIQGSRGGISRPDSRQSEFHLTIEMCAMTLLL